MELLSVGTARFVAGISTSELNPRGLLVYPALIEGMKEKYGFVATPNIQDTLDESKGIVFQDGAWNNIAIDKVTIFSDGIVVDTRSSTSDSEAIFEEAMQWAAESFGLTYKPEMVSHRRYVSELIVRTNASLNSLHSKLVTFSAQLSKSLSKFVALDVTLELSSVAFHYDGSAAKTTVAPFRLERLENSAYTENKYYALAPLPTEEHLALLEEFETILSKS